MFQLVASGGAISRTHFCGANSRTADKKKTKARNGNLKTALETLNDILSNDKKFLAPQLLRIPYESAEKQKKTSKLKYARLLFFTRELLNNSFNVNAMRLVFFLFDKMVLRMFVSKFEHRGPISFF